MLCNPNGLPFRYDKTIYLKPGDSQEHEEVWHYRHTGEEWVGGVKESVK